MKFDKGIKIKCHNRNKSMNDNNDQKTSDFELFPMNYEYYSNERYKINYSFSLWSRPKQQKYEDDGEVGGDFEFEYDKI